MMIFRFLVLISIFSFSTASFAQYNILTQNQELIHNLSKFENAYEVDSNYIKYQTKETDLNNYGYGVAFRKNAKVIYPAQKEINYFIKAYGNFIALAKKETLVKNWYGLINDKGETILDFKYDRIGAVVVPLPDSIITVQLGNKFGIFNLNTQKLSDIHYDNSNNYLNDGYNYHEGGAGRAREAIYNQLGITDFIPKINPATEYIRNARIIKNDSVAYLVDNSGKQISKNYDTDIERLKKIAERELYFGAVADTTSKDKEARNLFLIDAYGNELAEISSHNNFVNEYFAELDYKKTYYFFETKKVITPNEGFDLYLSFYSRDGFLGFKNYKTGQKLFIDKYGNQQIIGEIPIPKPETITEKLTEAEIIPFKKLETSAHRLGRIVKYRYNPKGELIKETGFENDYSKGLTVLWEDTYYYNKKDSVSKIMRYTGGDEAYDLNGTNKKLLPIKTYNKKGQLISKVFDYEDYHFSQTYTYDKQGKLIASVSKQGDNITHIKYEYNAKNLLTKEINFKNSKVDYSYLTSYDSKNRKIKYDMINAEGISSGYWLYQYNNKNQLIYKVDFYGNTMGKKSEVVEAPPPLPPAPKKQN